MAATPDPDEVLRSTDGKTNFQRLARLLISGGTSLLREEFDAIHPPSNLPTVLSCPATKIQLKAAKLTKPQWDCLYPSPGVYGMSAVFDVSLLFRLLMTICSLTPPHTGWNALPVSTDHSLTADLARIKYYRNSVYGHVSQKMEIPDDQFLILWPEISNPLVRIAAHISLEKKTAWQKAIDNFRNDPLTADDDRNVQELERWYKNDMDVKKSVEELKTTTQEGIDRLETMAIDFYWDFAREAQHFRADALDTKIQLQGIAQLLYLILISSFADSQSTGVSDAKPQEQLARVLTGIAVENVDNRSIPSAQDVLNTVAFKYFQSVDPSKPEELNAYLEYVEKMRKVLFNHGESVEARKILKELLTNYRTGQVNEMAQTFLLAENFLKEHGLIEEYTACRQGALKGPVTYPASMKNEDHASDLPKNQESLNLIGEQFAQLQRRCVELYNTLLGWIRIRARTLGELQSLSAILCKCPRNVFMACVNALSPAILVRIAVVLFVSRLIINFTFQIVVTYSLQIMYSC